MAKPVTFKELLQLTQLGIAQDHIKYKNVALEAKYVTVREEGKNSVAIIDTATKNVLRLPVPVDSAIMNPVSKVVALRADAQNSIQIYNLEMKTRMKTAQTPEPAVFWRWLDHKTIAFVTEKAVFHWSMDDNAPVKKFDRAPSQGPVQILNYQASKDGKWLILGGITSSNGQIAGVLQVHSVAMNASQPTMDSHAACFASVKIDGRESLSTLFCFTKNVPNQGLRLNILEIGVPKEEAFTQSAAINFQGGDFPVSMLADEKYGVLWIITKGGFLYVFEIQSGKQIFAQQVSKQTFFTSALAEDGFVAADVGGRVVQFGIDRNEIVPYICNTLNDLDLGVKFAQRYDLPGAGGIFQKQFMTLMQQGKYQEAMQLAVDSPQGILRNSETINALKSVQNGQLVLGYFQALLKKGSLNKVESIELCRPILARKQDTGIEMIKGWLKENKLDASEDLGDLLKNHNVTLALSVYLRGKVPDKVIGCFLSLGAQESNQQQALEHFKNILQYAQRVNFTPDYPFLVQQLASVNPDRAKDFALMLILDPEGPKVDVNQTVDAFLRNNDIKNTTNVLLEYLKPRGDRAEDAALQTKLLEINLLQMPQVADAILESEEYRFTHYDKLKIAQLCERAQLYQRALEHYTDLADVKRVLTNTPLINPEFLLEYFGRMSPENCIDCLRDLLKFNLQQNIRLVVEVAKKWSEVLTPNALIQLFEEFKSYNGIYFYLGSFVNTTLDAVLIFKYIEAATKLGQLKEVERVCRENEHLDPVKVKEFLLTQNLKDPRPLIHICDRFGFVEELTQYLYANQGLFVFIEAYIQRMNPKAAPTVIGTLLSLNASEEQIKKLLSNLRPPHDDPDFVGRLVDAVEKHGRLKMIRPFLEARNQEGSEDKHVHNGLAKIYVEVNNNPQGFLTSNRFYDSAIVGKFCETRDPHLAFIAYKRAWGECDDQLIEVTNKNGFFKDQARYLVERQDQALWAKVLVENNPHRRQLIDQVVATALPESRVPDEVSSTVKAFMAANLPTELIELLEKIILHGSASGEFHNNRSLQNLLILTAIKADKKRVMEYVKRLDNYDGPDIAKIAVSEQYQLYEEAFFIYKKYKKGPEAIQVLLDNMSDIPRATEFAEYWDTPDVWSILAKAQLDAKLVKEAIVSYLKANDATQFSLVLAAAKEAEFFTEVIDYIKMARSKVKDPLIDNELIYCFAKTEKLSDLEDFINGSHVAKLNDAGDRCFDDQLYHAAKILYNHVNNYQKLAITLLKLQSWQEAFNAAQKANAIGTWKAVCFAFVDAGQFRLAQMSGLNIIVYLDQLVECIRHYEIGCHFEEVIQLLEQGINLDRAHQGIFTQLGVLYSKYKEEKLFEHIKMFWSRLNIPTLLVACQESLHFTEAVFLYRHYDQFDQAVDLLINHSSECWTHELFKEAIKQVANTEIYYRSIDFYLREHPLLLVDLLMDMSTHLDHGRVTIQVSRAGCLFLIQRYLLHVQHDNLPTVNEAINKLFVEAEDYKNLRKSIDEFDQFDQPGLAQSLENHELIEFRRIAAHLYRINKRWDRSIDLSKKDGLWQDAMETTAASGDKEQAELLLTFFVEKGQYECFAACLYSCYELIRPDVVLELAWRYDLTTLAMPYMIQCFREFQSAMTKVNDKLQAQEEEARKIEDAQKKAEDERHQTDAAFVGTAGAIYNPMMAPLAIAPPPGAYGMMPQQPYYGGGGY